MALHSWCSKLCFVFQVAHLYGLHFRNSAALCVSGMTCHWRDEMRVDRGTAGEKKRRVRPLTGNLCHHRLRDPPVPQERFDLLFHHAAVPPVTTRGTSMKTSILPYCWQQKSQEACCYFTRGTLQVFFFYSCRSNTLRQLMGNK